MFNVQVVDWPGMETCISVPPEPVLLTRTENSPLLEAPGSDRLLCAQIGTSCTDLPGLRKWHLKPALSTFSISRPI